MDAAAVAVAHGDTRPDDTQSVAVAMIDRHEIAGDFVHWLVVNIPADETEIDEGARRLARVYEAAGRA